MHETDTSSPGFCSDVQGEPLPGTAKTGSTYVLFEWPGPWSRDVLDGGTFDAELTGKLKALTKQHRASLLLIRHPSREGRAISDHHVYLVFAEQAVIEVLHVNSPEDLLTLDLSGPGRNGATLRKDPLLLVCTHAKRDACCAVKGRPLLRELAKRYPWTPGRDLVWETSHIKGHRFAPTMLLLPWAYSFGRMNGEASDALLRHALAGRFFLPGNRGRGTLDAPAQAAELAVAQRLIADGFPLAYGELEVGTLLIDATRTHTTVTHPTSEIAFEVELERRVVDGVISSCGDAPKAGKSWEVVALRRAN